MSAQPRVVFFGDSITAGQHVDPHYRWTRAVARKLHYAFPGVSCEAKGAPGETTRQALERFPRDVQQVAPDVVTIQFGLNDCNLWETDRGLPRVSATAFKANLVEMITRARHFGVQEIVLLTVTPTLRGRVFEKQAWQYSTLVAAVAGEMGETLCNVRSEFYGRDLGPLLMPEPDLLHLSAKGHRVYADCVAPVLVNAVRDVASVEAA